MMVWTAPAIGIGVCQIAVAIAEVRESACGYKRLFGPCPGDFRFCGESGPPISDVRFRPVFVRFALGSGPSGWGRRKSGFDPTRTFETAIPTDAQLTELTNLLEFRKGRH
jgi:hypothetical protein